MTRLRASWKVTLALLALIGLTTCGGDSGGSSSPTTPTAPASPPVQNGTITTAGGEYACVASADMDVMLRLVQAGNEASLLIFVLEKAEDKSCADFQFGDQIQWRGEEQISSGNVPIVQIWGYPEELDSFTRFPWTPWWIPKAATSFGASLSSHQALLKSGARSKLVPPSH